ncbi:MAG: hypothetical protein ACYC2O_14010 [Microthrixaceae bacterium]
MTTSPESPQLAQDSDDVITAQLAEWARQDAAVGLRRERDMVQALKDRADMHLIELNAELQRSRERALELEVFATDLRIRLTQQEEVVAALRTELAAEYATRRIGPLARMSTRVRAALGRLRALLPG